MSTTCSRIAPNRKTPLLPLLAVALFTALGSASAPAADPIVDTLADGAPAADGACTLREAVQNAVDDFQTNPDCSAGSGPDTIRFSVSGTITLGSALTILSFDGATFTIDGAGQDVVLSGN